MHNAIGVPMWAHSPYIFFFFFFAFFRPLVALAFMNAQGIEEQTASHFI